MLEELVPQTLLVQIHSSPPIDFFLWCVLSFRTELVMSGHPQRSRTRNKLGQHLGQPLLLTRYQVLSICILRDSCFHGNRVLCFYLA